MADPVAALTDALEKQNLRHAGMIWATIGTPVGKATAMAVLACLRDHHGLDLRPVKSDEINAERLYRAVLGELTTLWGEPSDAISTQVRPIVAQNIVDRYVAATPDSTGARE